MITIKVGKNDQGRRLDRFLRKYYKQAPLSLLYKMIRKDIKVNGKRAPGETILVEGDAIWVYLSESESEDLRGASGSAQKAAVKEESPKAKRQFAVVYEDDEVLVVSKPYGLLTHGDSHEKKNTLVNQVEGYLIEKGDFVPAREQTFRPACVNRLDRNTTGLVVFGKTAEAVREMARVMADKTAVEKVYTTIVKGKVSQEMRLTGTMIKDRGQNKVRIVNADKTERTPSARKSSDGAAAKEEKAKTMETMAVPIAWSKGYTLLEVRIFTGRTHQIRVQLAEAGHPVLGDPKYGDRTLNDKMKKRHDLRAQLLHCKRLAFFEGPLAGKSVEALLPPSFEKIVKELFGNE